MTNTSAMPPPGCFGSPTCHAATALPCAQCPFEASCGPIAARVAEGLRRKYGIDTLLRRVSTRGRAVASGAMPVKVREYLDRFQSRGIDLPRAAAMGVNPFQGQPPAFMRVAMDLLLRGTLTRETLREALMRELAWTESSAQSHVSIAVALLLHSGTAVEQSGHLRLRVAEIAA